MPDHLVAFALTAVALIATPGPSVLFIVSRTLTLGRSAGLASVAGNAVGVYVQVVAVAIGIGALVEDSVAVFTTIKLAGAAYLVYLGVQAVRHRRGLRGALEAEIAPRSSARLVREAFLVGIANPKAIVFFAAILPQFVDRPAGHVPGQLLLLGAVFLTIGLICDAAWAFGASAARSWLGRSPRRLELIGGSGGVVMIAIGAHLAVSGRRQ